jgi:hypothetical protein
MAQLKPRFIRVDDDTWNKAMIRARSEQTNLSALTRKYLNDYANHRDKSDDGLELLLIAKQLAAFRDELNHTIQRLTEIPKRMK